MFKPQIHLTGLVFVVDSTDSERMSEASDELQNILLNENLTNVPILILANKQDLETAMDIRQVTEKMHMYKTEGREWFVQGCSALNNGDGLIPGFQTFSQMIHRFKKINLGKHKNTQDI